MEGHGVVVAAAGMVGLSAPAAIAQTLTGAVTITQSIAADGDLAVTSTGSITVTSEAAEATAIGAAADFGGTIVNAGTIGATVTEGVDDQSAGAIRFAGGTITGSVTSSGPITVSAIGDTAAFPDVRVDADGIHGPETTTDGASFTLNGPLSVTAQGGMTGGAG